MKLNAYPTHSEIGRAQQRRRGVMLLEMMATLVILGLAVNAAMFSMHRARQGQERLFQVNQSVLILNNLLARVEVAPMSPPEIDRFLATELKATGLGPIRGCQAVVTPSTSSGKSTSLSVSIVDKAGRNAASITLNGVAP